jgi:S-adenosylmethionine decarboxylase proenzyme
METAGRHVLAEYHGCPAPALDDEAAIRTAMHAAAKAAGATVIQAVFHRYAPQGVTGVLVLAESHISVHTWPESGYAAVDFFTCGHCDPEAAHEVLSAAFGARRAEILVVDRGQWPEGKSMRVLRHDVAHDADMKVAR